ncbi:MAG: hypothetical protein P4L83_20345 [Nevskia sp.]|nr:hypothetical protein [Nevskia sp.]
MHKYSLGAVGAFIFAITGYAAFFAYAGTGSAPPAQVAVKRSPEETAARDRMAQLVAEVAARSAARTAKTVALNHLQAPPDAASDGH